MASTSPWGSRQCPGRACLALGLSNSRASGGGSPKRDGTALKVAPVTDVARLSRVRRQLLTFGMPRRQAAGLMTTAHVSEADRAAKAALFSRFTQLLPAALAADAHAAGPRDAPAPLAGGRGGDGGGAEAFPRETGGGLVGDLLAVMRDVVAADRAPHQTLFRRACAVRCDRGGQYAHCMLSASLTTVNGPKRL